MLLDVLPPDDGRGAKGRFRLLDEARRLRCRRRLARNHLHYRAGGWDKAVRLLADAQPQPERGRRCPEPPAQDPRVSRSIVSWQCT